MTQPYQTSPAAAKNISNQKAQQRGKAGASGRRWGGRSNRAFGGGRSSAPRRSSFGGRRGGGSFGLRRSPARRHARRVVRFSNA